MSRVQLSFAVAIFVVWAATVYGALRNPDLIGLATIVTPVVMVPVGFIFAKGIRDQLRRGDPPSDRPSDDRS